MLENIKVGDFLLYKGHDIRNMFKTHYCYPVKSIEPDAGTLHFVNGFRISYKENFASVCWELRTKKISVYRHNHPCTQVVNVSDLKPGEYFRFYGKKQVYLVSDIKARGEWIYSKTSDVWGSYRNISKKSKRLVEIGFEY